MDSYNKERFTSHLSKGNPVEWTQSGPLVDSERTPSKPRADPKWTQFFEKQTQSELKENLGFTFGVCTGVRLGLVVTVYIVHVHIKLQRNYKIIVRVKYKFKPMHTFWSTNAGAIP